MGLYLAIGGLAVLLLIALIAYRAASRKPPVATGRGLPRFSRSAFDVKDNRFRSRQKSSFNYRFYLLVIAVLIILGWVGFSLAIRTSSSPPVAVADSSNESAPTGDDARDVKLTPIISGRLTGPPPEGPIPPGPAPPPPVTPPPVAKAPVATAPAETKPASIFSPDPYSDPNQPSIMAMAAQSLAPVISRMEPLGRTLTNPKKTPPKPSVAPKPKLPTPPTTPALVAPPVNAQATTPKATSEATPKATPKEAAPKPETPDPTKVAKWTVLLGAFGSQENAINLKARLEATGLPVSISEVMEKNKLWYRLNSGLFDDRETAEAYSRELRQKKLVERPYVKRL